jgi:hypothetical protein
MNADPKDIVRDYLLILEKRTDYGLAMPLSLLSHTKTEIKEAIKAVIQTIENVEEQDKLKMGYATLSEFIPDTVLEKVNKDWKDVADAECEVGQEPERRAGTDVMAEVIEVQKSIADEGARLSQEIAEYFRKIE